MKKKEKLLEIFGSIDDKYIAGSEEYMNNRKERSGGNNASKKRRRLIGLLAAALLLAAAMLVLFLPVYSVGPADITRFSGSEYYTLIEKINRITGYRGPTYKNNFERLQSAFEKPAPVNDNDENGCAITAYFTEKGDLYYGFTEDISGIVTEPDLMRKSDKYIYYLNRSADTYAMQIFSADGENSKQVGSYDLSYLGSRRIFCLYLSPDFKSATVIVRDHDISTVILLDVSDPANIINKKTVRVKGEVFDSRLVDGRIILFNTFWIKSKPDFTDESAFLPQIDTGNGFESVPPQNIVIPEEDTTSLYYKVIYILDQNTLELTDSLALLSERDGTLFGIYVSESGIYVCENIYERLGWACEIKRISYRNEKLALKGSLRLKGFIFDRFWLDERDGILRVVTQAHEYDGDDGEYNGVNFYCIDVRSLEIIGETPRLPFADYGIESVRFEGDHAYVCMRDGAIIFFDPSDPQNITFYRMGKTYENSIGVVEMSGGLLCIGISDYYDVFVKMEIFREFKPGGEILDSVARYEKDKYRSSRDHRSYLIDRENGLLGFKMSTLMKHPEDPHDSVYILLHYDGEKLTELKRVSVEGSNDCTRSFIKDRYLYIISESGLAVEPFETPETGG